MFGSKEALLFQSHCNIGVLDKDGYVFENNTMQARKGLGHYFIFGINNAN
jgi:hypothetical protein